MVGASPATAIICSLIGVPVPFTAFSCRYVFPNSVVLATTLKR